MNGHLQPADRRHGGRHSHPIALVHLEHRGVALLVASWAGSSVRYGVVAFDRADGTELMDPQILTLNGNSRPAAMFASLSTSHVHLYITGTDYDQNGVGSYWTTAIDVAGSGLTYVNGWSPSEGHVLKGLSGYSCEARAMCRTPNGFAITGTAYPVWPTTGPAEYYTVAYELLQSTSMTRWEERYLGPGDSEVSSIAAATVVEDDPQLGLVSYADVRVTGRSWGGSQSGWDALTINYNDVNGDVHWIGRWDSGGDEEGLVVTHSQLIDGAPLLDHIYVAGRILDATQRWNMVVLRYTRAATAGNKPTSWDDPSEIPVYSTSGDEFATAFLMRIIDYPLTIDKRFWLIGASDSDAGTKWRSIQYRDDKP
jgi:hypothetical protein